MRSTSLITSAILFSAASGAAITTVSTQAFAETATATTAATDIARGVIERVAPDDNEFDLRVVEDEALNEEKITFTVTDKTAYTLDGEESTMKAALKTDRRAVVLHEDNVAIRVDVTTRKSPN